MLLQPPRIQHNETHLPKIRKGSRKPSFSRLLPAPAGWEKRTRPTDWLLMQTELKKRLKYQQLSFFSLTLNCSRALSSRRVVFQRRWWHNSRRSLWQERSVSGEMWQYVGSITPSSQRPGRTTFSQLLLTLWFFQHVKDQRSSVHLSEPVCGEPSELSAAA